MAGEVSVGGLGTTFILLCSIDFPLDFYPRELTLTRCEVPAIFSAKPILVPLVGKKKKREELAKIAAIRASSWE